jgi:hypothetical protein
MLFEGEQGKVEGRECMVVLQLDDGWVTFPEFIRRDAGHQSRLVIDHMSKLFLGNVPGGAYLEGSGNVIFNLHSVLSCGGARSKQSRPGAGRRAGSGCGKG